MWEIKTAELIAGKHKTEKKKTGFTIPYKSTTADLKLCHYDSFLKVSTISNQHQARKQDSIT